MSASFLALRYLKEKHKYLKTTLNKKLQIHINILKPATFYVTEIFFVHYCRAVRQFLELKKIRHCTYIQL